MKKIIIISLLLILLIPSIYGYGGGTCRIFYKNDDLNGDGIIDDYWTQKGYNIFYLTYKIQMGFCGLYNFGKVSYHNKSIGGIHYY